MIVTSRCRLLRDVRGIVFVEFLVSIVPLWTLALSAFQLSMISAANLVTKHAADAAARSASVVLPDDPGEYGGEPERTLDRSAVALGFQGPSRLQTIERAASVPLIPFSPRDLVFASRPSLERALPSPVALGAALARQPSQVSVSFAGASGRRVFGAEATVRVTHLFECVVPVARRLLCDSRDGLEREHGLPQATLRLIRDLGGGRFRLLAHETTLLIHDAPYEYRPQGS